VAEDRALEPRECRRRLEADVIDEREASRPVGVERIGLTSGVVEGEDQLGAEALIQWLLLHEALELSGQLSVASAGEIGVDPISQAATSQPLEPGDLGLREALIGYVEQRRSAPHFERLPQGLRGESRPTAGDLLSPPAVKRLEPIRVDDDAAEGEGVPAPL